MNLIACTIDSFDIDYCLAGISHGLIICKVPSMRVFMLGRKRAYQALSGFNVFVKSFAEG